MRDLTSFRLAVATRQPVISDVDTSVQPPMVRLRMPVTVDGVVRYVVTVVMAPDAFDGVLHAQRVPESWVIALVDRNRRVIARIPSLPAGTSVSEGFRSAINRSPSGWFSGQTLEGTRTYTAYVTSEPSGWVLGIAIPASTVDAAANRTLIGMGGGVAAALAIALLLGWYMARRIAQAGRRARRGDRGDGARQGRADLEPGRHRRDHPALRRAARRGRRGARAQRAAGAREGGAAGEPIAPRTSSSPCSATSCATRSPR